MRRVVITGTGYISAVGNNIDDVVRNIREDKISESFVSLDRDIRVREVADFNIKDYTGREKKVKYLNRGAAFSVASALKAFESSGLKKGIKRAGIIASSGPNLDFGSEIDSLNGEDISKKGLNALWLLRFLPNTATTIIASKTGFNSENMNISSACASSLSAIGEAYRKVKDGYLDVALTGGGDSRLNKGGLLAYEMASALSRSNKHRPFDERRDGFIAGEGGAFLVLEDLNHALERGANILGEVKGYGVTLDNVSLTAPDPAGVNARRAVCDALSDAGMKASGIDFISSHGTGTFLNDKVETDIIERVFGADVKTISVKSWTGHLSTACGALETALSLDFMISGFLPQIRGLEKPIRKTGFNMENCEGKFNSFLLSNYGFGGQNSSLVIKRWIQNT